MIPIEVEKLKGTLTRLILTEMAFQLEDEMLKSKPQLLNGKEQEGETPQVATFTSYWTTLLGCSTLKRASTVTDVLEKT